MENEITRRSSPEELPQPEKKDASDEVDSEKTAPRRDAEGKKSPTYTDREIFDLTSLVDNRMVRNYEPKFLAKGGEHIVYEIPGREDVIVKVDARIIRKTQEHNAASGLPLDAADTNILPFVQEKLAEDRALYQQLRDHFGREHVPNIKQDYIKIPITPPMTYALHKKHPPEGWKQVKEVWSVVKVQRRVPEVSRPGKLNMQFGYLESRHQKVGAAYERLTRAFVDGLPPEDFKPTELDDAILPMKAVMTFADTDPACAAVVQDFVSKAISYAQKTGSILDLAGKDNVIFFQTEGKWDYKLIDALYPGEADMLGKVGVIIRKVAAGTELEDYERNMLLNTVNFVRGINGLAARLGLPDRVEIVPDELKGKIDFYSAIEK